jgi:hypothetical protein
MMAGVEEFPLLMFTPASWKGGGGEISPGASRVRTLAHFYSAGGCKFLEIKGVLVALTGIEGANPYCCSPQLAASDSKHAQYAQ